MFRLIVSPEDYMLKQRIIELQGQMQQSGEDIETVIVSQDDISAEQLFEILDFSPLFAAGRLVVLHKMPLWDDTGRRAQLLSQVKEGLLAYMKNPPQGQWVVATANKASLQNPLVMELKKMSALEEIKPPTLEQRQAIIKKEAELRGLAIGEQELKLIGESQQDLTFITTMLDKWRLLPGIKIDRELLAGEGITTDSEGGVFALVDALIAGQAAKALAEWHRLQETGEPVFKMLATVNRQLMTLAKVKGWGEEGRSAQEIAVDIGDKKGYRTKRLLQDARRVDWQRLRRLFGLIAKTDILIKTGKMPEGMAVEYMILQSEVIKQGCQERR